jgi:uncharacterized membrane protein YdjX (TVP38/TMEM64 family)
MKPNEESKENKAKRIIRSFLPIIIFILALSILTLILLPEIRRLGTEEGRTVFAQFVEGLGFGGWLVTLGIQVLQILVAFIPGEPVELMLGFVWGPWLGTVTCLLGIFLGSLIIYLFVKRLGMPFIRRAVGDGDIKRYKFLEDKSRVELTLFILFFIPGTPKDVITYIAPLAPISPVKYFLITTLARIPSVVTSTVLGGSVAEGDYLVALIIFIVTAVISLLGIILGNKFVAMKSKVTGCLGSESASNSETTEKT